MAMSPPPTMIVLEGAEGAGKTTQLQLLAEVLRASGRDVVTVREPGGTPLGDSIRRLLLDPGPDMDSRAEALLFMASRAQLVESVVRPALAKGAVVLIDRFMLSTYAYQSGGRGLDQREIAAANTLATGGMIPGLTVLLRLPVDEGLDRAARRGPRDRIEGAARGFHERVSAAFDSFATPEWQRSHPECGPIVSVDASGAPDAVLGRVRTVIAQRWPEMFSVPVVPVTTR